MIGAVQFVCVAILWMTELGPMRLARVEPRSHPELVAIVVRWGQAPCETKNAHRESDRRFNLYLQGMLA